MQHFINPGLPPKQTPSDESEYEKQREMQTYLMLVMSVFVLDMNWLTLDESVSIESRSGIIASAVLSTFLTVEQSEKKNNFAPFLLKWNRWSVHLTPFSSWSPHWRLFRDRLKDSAEERASWRALDQPCSPSRPLPKDCLCRWFCCLSLLGDSLWLT